VAKYRKKVPVVEALQWLPGMQLPGVFLYQPPDAVLHDKMGGSQRFPQNPYMAVANAHGQMLRVEPGDWIVAEPDGRGHVPYSPEEFKATYEPCKED
jgi:hypothetical protein